MRELFRPLFDWLTRYLTVCGFVLWDSGGGGGNTTTTTSNIPDWLQDPTKRMVARGEALTGPDAQYQQYGGPRTAGMTDLQTGAIGGIAGLGDPQQFGMAQGALGGAQGIANAAAMDGASYQPGTFQAAGYDPSMQGYTGYEASLAQQGPAFDYAAAQQYMSPYQQGVTDISKRLAAQEGMQMQNQVAANAARNGAFGGSRFGLEAAKVYNDTGQRLSDIQTQGSQSAYDRAMQQFNADQQRFQTANLANAGFQNDASRFGASAYNTAEAANAAAANQALQFGGQNMMTAQQMAEQSRQFGNDAGLRGADLAARTGLSAASQLADLGTRGQQASMDRYNALAGYGAQQQAINQKDMDVGYENFVNARDYDRNNLQFLSGLLRGNPVSTRQETITPAPSTASTLGGLGLAGLGAYKMFGG